MTITAAQQLLLDLAGDLDPETGDLPAIPEDGIVYQHAAELWARYADKAFLSPLLRDLYIMRDEIDLLLSVVSPEVNASAPGGSVNLNQRAQTYLARRREIQAEIERIEVLVTQTVVPGNGHDPVMLDMINVVPIPAPLFGPDANSPVYNGSPYRYGRRWWGR